MAETENVPLDWTSLSDWQRKVANTVNQILRGKLNSGNRTVTLTAGAGSTAVTEALCSVRSMVALMPTTANAAAALGTTYIAAADGSFTVTHANNAQTDRTFAYSVIG